MLWSCQAYSHETRTIRFLILTRRELDRQQNQDVILNFIDLVITFTHTIPVLCFIALDSVKFS